MNHKPPWTSISQFVPIPSVESSTANNYVHQTLIEDYGTNHS